MQHLHEMGFGPSFLAQLDLDTLDDPPVGRVCFEAHGHLTLLTPDPARPGGRERQAILDPKLHDRRDRVVVGDWVVYDRRWDPVVVTRRLERASLLRRRDPDKNVGVQAIAANLDRLLVCTAVGADFSVRRLERWRILAAEAGVEVVVVLTKADRGLDVSAERAAAERVADVVIAVSARDDVGLERLRALVEPRRTVALLGSSGVGKSTLVNLLLGGEVQATGGIRAFDERGRHTTTARHLFRLPNGAWLLDNPGVRQVGVIDGEGLDAVFADVVGLAEGCRFRDCRHDGEPGCAIADAIEAGELDPERLQAWRKLEREAAHEARRGDALAMRAEKERWKRIHKGQRERDRLRGKDR